MRFVDLVTRSGRTLRSAKLRTLLTALAIGVGAFTLALTLAASNGLRDYTDKLVASNFDPAELLVGRDPEVTNTGTPSEKPKEFDESVSAINFGGGQGSLQLKRVTTTDVESLRSMEGVEQVRESYQITVRYITRAGQKKYTAGAEVYNQAQKPEIRSGSLPSSGDIEGGGVLLPDNYLEPLGFASPEEALGKEVSVSVEQAFSENSLAALINTPISEITPDDIKPEEQIFTYRIAGITKKPATSFSFGVSPTLLSSADSRELYDYTTKGTSDYGKYLFVYVRVKDGSDKGKLQAVQQKLTADGYYVMSSEDIQKAITQFVNILTIMVGVFGLITVVASVFGIVNTQYISVLERTREIGLMKALGMSRKNISRLFILEAAWVGFIGGLIGTIIALVVGLSINPWLTRKLELGDGNTLLRFDFVQILILLAGLMLVAAVAGLLPARKASKLDPVEALRTE